jgi:hypothetical protein
MAMEPQPKPDKTFSIDGVEVKIGMAFWDYDLRRCTVLEELSYNPYEGVIWFQTTTGMFDGLRLWRRHPTTREVA